MSSIPTEAAWIKTCLDLGWRLSDAKALRQIYRKTHPEMLKDRYGHNHSSGPNEPRWSRVTYLAHAQGYVMARRPGRPPFVLTSEQWLAFPLWEKGRHHE